MSLSHALGNALSGLTAASRMAEVVSNNLANALTDGYGRRQLDLSSAALGGRGSGVRIDGIQRIVDHGLLADRWRADADLAARSGTAATLQRIEDIFGAVGDDHALPARITALESALVAAGNDPSSDIRLADVLDRLGAVTRTFNDSAAQIQRDRQEADAGIARMVETLNTSLDQIQSMNIDISKAIASGVDPSSLMDSRQRAIDSIAELVPLRAIDRPGGQLALVTLSGEVMLDGTAATYDFVPTPVITADMTLASGGLNGITRDGQPLTAANGIGKLGGGALGAAFDRRDRSLVAAADQLDSLARDLIERFEDPATDATRPPGAAGLLTDGGGSLDPLGGPGLASRISVNALADPDRGGALFRLRDGIGAATPGPVGEGAQLTAWRSALSAQRPLSTGGLSAGAADHANAMIAAIGLDRASAEETLGFASARQATLREAELAKGVDSDQEMQMLLRVEQAYAANARVMETLDAMMRRLMEI